MFAGTMTSSPAEEHVERLERNQERCSPGGHSDAVVDLAVGGELAFEGVDLRPRTYCADSTLRRAESTSSLIERYWRSRSTKGMEPTADWDVLQPNRLSPGTERFRRGLEGRHYPSTGHTVGCGTAALQAAIDELRDLFLQRLTPRNPCDADVSVVDHEPLELAELRPPRLLRISPRSSHRDRRS